MKKLIICAVAIAGITAIELMALSRGINGAYLSLSIGTISAVAGFIAGKKV